jgi:surfactin synthase thioesterase subunit
MRPTETAGPPRGRWVERLAPNPRARLRLVCCHAAGLSAAVFRHWPRRMPAAVEVCAVQLPGRGARMSETPERSVDNVVAAVARVLPDDGMPLLLFGHSLGATIAFETARARRRAGLAACAHLFVAGRGAPHLASTRAPLHGLSDAEFVAAVQARYNGIPDAVAREPELLELLLPMLRADIEMHERYVHRTEPPLPCPITGFVGREDATVAPAQLDAWAAHTSAGFAGHVVPGGHFFVTADDTAWMVALTSRIEELTAGA